MKRGPKAKPNHLKEAAGTARKSRMQVPVFAAVGGFEEPIKPSHLTPEVEAVWDAKVAEYRRRGQRVRGFEDALAIYCGVEAQIIATMRQGLPVSINLLKEHRAQANEFYDTPAASRIGVAEALKPDNPFAALLKS